MADSKLSDLTALTSPVTGDLLYIADVSEAVEADRSKKITVQNLIDGAAPLLTSNITITKQDPSIIFNAGQGGDTKYWIGVQDDNGNDDDDFLDIGTGTTPGTNRKLRITKDGAVLFPQGSVTAPAINLSGPTITTGFYIAGDYDLRITQNGKTTARFDNNVWRILNSNEDQTIALQPQTESILFGTSEDAVITRDAANILAFRRSTDAQSIRVYGTFIDSSNYERAALITTAGTGIELAAQTAGTGADNLNVKLTPAGTGLVQFGTHSALGGESVTGFITIKDSGGTDRKIAVVS